MRPEIRIGGSCNDAEQNDLMATRIAVVRDLMIGMRHQEATVPNSASVVSRDGSLIINAVEEAKSSRIACFVRRTVDGVRRDTRLVLSSKIKDPIRDETSEDPYAPLRVLEHFEALGRRREIFVQTLEIGYHVTDPAGDALTDLSKSIARTASALVLGVNPDPYEHHRITVHAPCMGRPGRIVDHRSRNLFAKPLLTRLFAEMPDVVKLNCHNGNYYEVEPVSWQYATTRMGVDEVLRTTAALGEVDGSHLLTAAGAAD